MSTNGDQVDQPGFCRADCSTGEGIIRSSSGPSASTLAELIISRVPNARPRGVEDQQVARRRPIGFISGRVPAPLVAPSPLASRTT